MPFGFGRGFGNRMRGRFRGGRWSGWLGSPRVFPSYCICSQCGMIVPYQQNVPCFKRRCPRCNSPMARQFFSGK